LVWNNTILLQKKIRQVYSVRYSRLHNHTLFIKKLCKNWRVSPNFGRSGPPNPPVVARMYRSTVIARLMYASSAWRGLASTSDRQRIDSVIDRARRNGYCASDLPSFDELCDDADDELFNKAVHLPNHVLHFLLHRHLTHHKDTYCVNERIYCNYLIIPHTC